MVASAERPRVVFRPAVRSNVGLILGVIGASGSGKSFSSFRLAAGIAGSRPFAVIDTEAGRATHYADLFRLGNRCAFDHAELHAPFRPDAYTEAILEADRAGYPAIVVDSASHEYAGEGGVLDWAEEESGKGDIGKWIKPKMAHKRFMSRLLQVRATLILCFRAEEKTLVLDMQKPGDQQRVQQLVANGTISEKDASRRTVIAPGGWQPVCEKRMPYELTVALLLTPDRPGYPQPLKLQEQHKAFFPLDQVISERAGQMVAEWARGGEPPDVSPYERDGLEAATRGVDALRTWYRTVPTSVRRVIEPKVTGEFLASAKEVDSRRGGEQPEPEGDGTDWTSDPAVRGYDDL